MFKLKDTEVASLVFTHLNGQPSKLFHTSYGVLEASRVPNHDSNVRLWVISI